MQTLIQATSDEFINLVRQAVREELKGLNEHQISAEEQAMTKKEAAAYLRVSLSTLERLIKCDVLPVLNIGKRVFIRRSDLAKQLQK